MKPSTLLAALSLTPPSLTWIVPHDLEDGLYTVSFSHDPDSNTPNGTTTDADPIITKRQIAWDPPENLGFDPFPQNTTNNPTAQVPHNPIENPPKLRPQDAVPGGLSGAVPVPVSEWDCQYNVRPIPERDWVQAREGLFSYCDGLLLSPRSRHLAVAKKGKAVVYACNFHKKKYTACHSREYKWIEQHYLDLRCGQLRSGWVTMRKWKKTYGRGVLGMEICPGRKMKQTAWEGYGNDGPYANKEMEWGYVSKDKIAGGG